MSIKKAMHELDRADLSEFKQQDKFPLVLILDQVRSGLNVGSIFRTADAFAIESIVCIGYTPCPPHREVLKTALGSAQSVHWQSADDVQVEIHNWKEKGYSVFALEQVHGSVALQDWTVPSKPIVLILGNEVTGVSEEALALCDGFIEITQFGTKHSLNVAVSGGMAIYQVVQQWVQSGLKK
jgi:23S rRNA (guanosine2251-2'-O)-methyltransferase